MKIVPQIDTYPRLVTFTQTAAGKMAMVAAFALVLLLSGRAEWIQMTAVMAAITFFPERRRLLLSAAAACWLVLYGNEKWEVIRRIAAMEHIEITWRVNLLAGVIFGGLFAGIAALFQHIRKRPQSFPARRPVYTLIGGYFLILGVAAVTPLHGFPRLAIWTFLVLAGLYRWSFAYTLVDASARKSDGFLRQIGTFFPFWNGSARSATPYGKGAAYLRKIEARTPKDFAIVQLKGLKLILWAFILNAVLRVFMAVAHGDMAPRVKSLVSSLGLTTPALGIPTLESALAATAAGVPIPAWTGWASLLSHYIVAMLTMATYGHYIIGYCRMAGFNALRNTYRPLEAISVAEFWNRYYYYFKELLVDFFFLPAYLRFFKNQPRLRMIAATFAAACAGNWLYHFDAGYVAEAGLGRALAASQSYAFYSACLAIGISVSQLRSKSRPPRHAMTLPRRLLASAGVIAFFCLLDIFDYSGPQAYPLATSFRFVAGLFSFGS